MAASRRKGGTERDAGRQGWKASAAVVVSLGLWTGAFGAPDSTAGGGGFEPTALTDITLLSTGQGAALQRTNLSFVAAAGLTSLSLRFSLAFGTEEAVVSGEFYDAFTITLRNTSRAYNATLLTADLFGPAWSPANPSGQSQTNRLLFEPLAAPSYVDQFAVRYAYAVAVEIPAMLLGQTGDLSLSLFDNLDADSSLGLVGGLSLGLSLSAPVRLESSAAAGGPFAEEIGVVHNRVRQTLTLPGGSQARFYRLRADGSSRLAGLRRVGDQLVFAYEAALPTNVVLVLEKAETVTGYYHAIPEARFDLANHTARVPRALGEGFLRLRGNVAAFITGTRFEDADLVLTFIVKLLAPRLESSAQAHGPFAPETGVVPNEARQEMLLPVRSQARFFRLRSEAPLRIRRFERAGHDSVIHYDLP